MKTVTDASLRPEVNNLSFVRLCLASAVIYSHCKGMLTGSMDDIFTVLIGENVSSIAVDAFFFLSGFLVYRSLARRGDAFAFLRARLIRLWPGLAAMVVLVTIVWVAAFGGRIGSETIGFVLRNLTLQAGGYRIDGVGVVNGSLWSISWEIMCYLLLALLALFGMASTGRMKRVVLPAALAFALLYHLLPFAGTGQGADFFLGRIDRLWTIFLLGSAAMVWRDRLVLDWRIALPLFGLAAAVHQTGLHTHIEAVAIGYGVLCFGFCTGSFSGKWHDYSYGMYIYAYPVMLLLIYTGLFPDYRALALANVVATMPFAAFSWHVIEHPVLDRGRSPVSPVSRAFGAASTVVLIIPALVARGLAALRARYLRAPEPAG